MDHQPLAPPTETPPATRHQVVYHHIHTLRTALETFDQFLRTGDFSASTRADLTGLIHPLAQVIKNISAVLLAELDDASDTVCDDRRPREWARSNRAIVEAKLPPKTLMEFQALIQEGLLTGLPDDHRWPLIAALDACAAAPRTAPAPATPQEVGR